MNLRTQKPLKEDEFKSQTKQDVYNKLNRGEFLCSSSYTELRKIVYEIKNKFNMDIQTLTCDCNKILRTHKSYYYEWANEFKQ